MGRSVKRFGKVALGTCVGLAIAGCVSDSQSNRVARAAPPVVFAPPRADFSRRPGLVNNAGEYPLPDEIAALGPLAAAD